MKRAAIWLANGALLVLCCFLAARIVTAVAAEALAPAPEAEIAVAATEPVQARSWADRQVILQRKLFDTAEIAPDASSQSEPEEETYAKTRLPLALHGTVAGHPALSWAAVEDLETRDHLVVRVGDKLKNRAEVVRIERRRLVLRNGGKLEELSLDEEQDAPAPQRTAQRRAQRRPTRARGDSRSRVRQLAENRFSVARQDVEAVASNPAELFSQARILPKYENGEMKGVQLNAIKPGSIFESIGIENGDVITQFNGIEVTNQQESAAVLRELTQAKRFDVVVDRGGSPVELSYEIE